MADNNQNKFDPFVINARRPVESVFIVGGWWFVLPAILAIGLGIYNADDFMGVLGISARRGIGAGLNELKPAGESLLNARSGKGLRPGGFDNNSYDIRPGASQTNNSR